MDAARKLTDSLDDPWISMPKAAAELGCTRYLVTQFILRGQLKSTSADGRTFVDRKDVSRLKVKRKAAV